MQIIFCPILSLNFFTLGKTTNIWRKFFLKNLLEIFKMAQKFFVTLLKMLKLRFLIKLCTWVFQITLFGCCHGVVTLE